MKTKEFKLFSQKKQLEELAPSATTKRTSGGDEDDLQMPELSKNSLKKAVMAQRLLD